MFPPIGLQEVARRFRCRGCYSTVCDLPLDCPGEGRGLEGQEPEKLERREPSGGKRGGLGRGRSGDAARSPVQDLTVTRGDQAMFSCTVNFQLPKEEITYSWKFAGGGVSWSRASALGLGGGLCFIEDGVRTLGGTRSRFGLRARGGVKTHSAGPGRKGLEQESNHRY